MAYLYRHIRLDRNEVFYIGIGSDNRGYYERAIAKDPRVRNKFWNRIVNKTAYEVEIMLDNLTFEEAKCKEVEFIKLYGRRDKGLGTLCNLTGGGEGMLGFVMSESSKLAISKAITGVERSSAYKAAKRNFMLGRKLSEDVRQRMSKAQTKSWANKNRLSKQSKVVLDLETGICFDSVAICYRALNITRNSMCKRLKNGKRFIYVT